MMRRGAYVRFKPPKAPRQGMTGRGAEPVEHIPGRWHAFNEAEGASWWLLPMDGDARTWAAAHPDRIVSGCLKATTQQLQADYR